jgi:DHA2 family multidrug resistance protein
MSEPVRHRTLITGFLMTATLMQVLDSTIANVALPYMQGSLNTTLDQISWVLTSYVIASAIMTAPVGWLAARFGRKQLFITCLVGFVITSMMCGAAQSLEQMVVFRMLQGGFGAALVPLSQASMLDIYTAEQRASAMAVFGIGVMVGPILGPTLGGYLTDVYNWRWVFYVNLPIGIAAVIGLIVFMPSTPVAKEMKFDWTGFSVLAIGIGAFQLMLDRGQSEDWFNSSQIITEAVLAGLGIYLFLVHMFTTERPFIPLALFRDRYFTMATLLMFTTNTIMMASSALLAPYLQNLSGYPVASAGLLMAPRGIGTMVAMVITGRLGMRVDQRRLMFVGLSVLGWTLHDMSTWTPDIPAAHLVMVLIVQGFAMGWVWNPITLISFTTLPASLRGDATAVQSLMRNVCSAIGISVTAFTLARGVQISHAGLTADMTPFNRLLQGQWSAPKILSPWTTHGAELLDSMVNRQALIIAYANDFRMMSFVVVPALFLLLLVRRQRMQAAGGAVAVAD